MVLGLALGIALIPCSLMGQEEKQEEGQGWTSGLVTGVVGGTGARSLAVAGSCALAGIDVGNCAGEGALYSLLPALASGYGLSYPGRMTSEGRLRTVALGAAGGLLLWLVMELDPSVYAASPGSGRFHDAMLWGAGIGLVTSRRALRRGFPLSGSPARVGPLLPTPVAPSWRPR